MATLQKFEISGAAHPMVMGESTTWLICQSDWGWGGRVHLCRVASNSVWSHMAGGTSHSEMYCVNHEALYPL